MTPELQAAFARCRAIARREAKNFYYAFVALPRAKSDAMCAMYAFMRRADDIADDEQVSVHERRVLMQRWTEAFQTNTAFTDEDRLVFVAVRETQRRYDIPDALLDDLIAGTAMDLAEELPVGVVRVGLEDPRLSTKTDGAQSGGSQETGVDCYETFEALDRYCYLVASVVGLVTVRIFGVSGSSADPAAVRMGMAFQYTNIVRDVREDAERGRVYLPLDLLRAHGTSVEAVLAAARSGVMASGLQAALAAMGGRAEEYYGARRELVPLLDRDSRPAMRVLIRIYHALLRKIRRKGYGVFGSRVSVATAWKVAILLRGLMGSMMGRIG